MSTHATAFDGDASSTHQFDVAIVGAGLGGACAAIALARRGARVLVLEAARMPRHKVCGEFLSSEISALFSRLNVLEDVQDAGAIAVRAARIVRGSRVLAVDLPPGALAISRWRLDETLWRKAVLLGAHACDNTRVKAIEPSGDGFSLKTTAGDFNARLVLSAAGRNVHFASTHQNAFLAPHKATDTTKAETTGAKTSGAKNAGASMPPHEYSWRGLWGKNSANNSAAARTRHIGFKTHFRDVDLDAGIVELHLFDGGYCGLVRIENGLTNVCLLARYDTVANRAPHVFWESLLRQMPALRARMRDAKPAMPWLATANISFGHKQPVAHLAPESRSPDAANDVENTSQNQDARNFASDCCSAHGAILQCGDAAGFIHPLTGDGMAMAARGGELAAAIIDAALRSGLPLEDVARVHEAAWRREFAARLRWGARLQPLATSPRATSIALAVLNASPNLARRAVALTRGA